MYVQFWQNHPLLRIVVVPFSYLVMGILVIWSFADDLDIAPSTLWLGLGMGFLVSVLLTVPLLIRYIYNLSTLRQSPVIPIFSPPENLKFYELGLLNDGFLTKADFLSICVYYFMNPQDKDEFIQRKLRAHDSKAEIIETYDKLYEQTGDNSAEKERSYLRTKTYAFYNKLVQDGYYRFNPILLQRVTTFFIPILFLGFPFIAELGLSVLAFISLAVLIALSIYALSFHERNDKIAPLRRDLLGYKMYLETVELHTIKFDMDKRKQHLPYLIKFGIKQDKHKELLRLVLG